MVHMLMFYPIATIRWPFAQIYCVQPPYWIPATSLTLSLFGIKNSCWKSRCSFRIIEFYTAIPGKLTVLSLTASGANLLCTYVYIFVNPGATRTSSVVIFRTLCIRSVERRNPLIYYPILFHISTLWWSCSSILLSCLFRMSKYVGISYVLYEGIIVLKIYLKSWVPYSRQCHSPQWDIIL